MKNEEIINLLTQWRSLPDDYISYLRSDQDNSVPDGITIFPKPITANKYFKGIMQHEGNGNLLLFAKVNDGRYYGYNVSFMPYRVEYVEESNGFCSTSDAVKSFSDLLKLDFKNPVTPNHSVSIEEDGYQKYIPYFVIISFIIIVTVLFLGINIWMNSRPAI